MLSAHVVHGESLFEMSALLAQGTPIHAVVCDPPYHLTSVVKRFGGANAAPAKHGTDGAFARASRGFMGQQWDGGDIAFRPETWRAAWDLLPPGGHLIAFSGTRTYHRMACAIEDAGFEIRDQLAWMYGTGFPKSHNVGNDIDKRMGHGPRGRAIPTASGVSPAGEKLTSNPVEAYVARSPEAAPWVGHGTALKPAWEPIVLARKPLISTVAENVLTHRAGALNIDACRVSAGAGGLGRWPANIAHDGSEEVEAAFAAFGERGASAPVRGDEPSEASTGRVTGKRARVPGVFHGDSGTASRFFYSAKASADDRCGSKHPTVKPVSLMRWLVRMVCPPGGTVLDPFAGSGTTLQAALAEGCSAIGIEGEAAYVADIARRIASLGKPAPLLVAAE